MRAVRDMDAKKEEVIDFCIDILALIQVISRA